MPHIRGKNLQMGRCKNHKIQHNDQESYSWVQSQAVIFIWKIYKAILVPQKKLQTIKAQTTDRDKQNEPKHGSRETWSNQIIFSQKMYEI